MALVLAPFSVFFFFFLTLCNIYPMRSHLAACGILAPRPGIEPGPWAVKAWSPNHWTTREFPRSASELGFASTPSVRRVGNTRGPGEGQARARRERELEKVVLGPVQSGCLDGREASAERGWRYTTGSPQTKRKNSAKPPACHGMPSLQSSKTSPIPLFFLIPPALSLEGAKAALSGRRESESTEKKAGLMPESNLCYKSYNISFRVLTIPWAVYFNF